MGEYEARAALYVEPLELEILLVELERLRLTVVERKYHLLPNRLEEEIPPGFEQNVACIYEQRP